MAAYWSSKHDITGFTLNMLMLGREVHALADLVYGTSKTPAPKTYNNYVDELEERLKFAYSEVRKNLGAVAVRSK